MATPLVSVIHLTKVFPGGVRAVDDLTLHIPAGVCFGILGPNGAGKTTTVEIMEGVQAATSGSLLYRGAKRGPDFKQRIGIQFQETALPDFLRGIEVLRLFRSFYETQADLDTIIHMCGLEDFLDRDTRKLSGGQRQRLLLALALVNDPEVLFLDEPTTGLDPHARRKFWDMVRLIVGRGKTVVLTTHYMDEAYTLCDELVIMNQGKIIAQASPQALLHEHFDLSFVRVPVADAGEASLEVALDAARDANDFYTIRSRDVNETLRILIGLGVNLSRVEVRMPTLDDLFVKLVSGAERARNYPEERSDEGSRV